MELVLRNCAVPARQWPVVMGILNVTPDSFSDGGRFNKPAEAVDAALEMIADGAAIIDVGPESTRPGSEQVAAEEQIRRSVPVIQGIRSADTAVTISIDTTSSRVARAALDAGADIINDTSALRDDPNMVSIAVESNATVCLMHRKGKPATMQHDGGPQYKDVVAEIREFLLERAAFAKDSGINPARIVVDPGIGFGKRTGHNLQITGHLHRLADLGFPLLVGVSRKRFIGEVLGIDDPRDRDAGSLTCAVLAAQAGAAIVRVHDVASTTQAVAMLRSIRDA